MCVVKGLQELQTQGLRDVLRKTTLWKLLRICYQALSHHREDKAAVKAFGAWMIEVVQKLECVCPAWVRWVGDSQMVKDLLLVGVGVFVRGHGAQNLQGDEAICGDVLCQPYSSGAAEAELTMNSIAVVEYLADVDAVEMAGVVSVREVVQLVVKDRCRHYKM